MQRLEMNESKPQINLCKFVITNHDKHVIGIEIKSYCTWKQAKSCRLYTGTLTEICTNCAFVTLMCIVQVNEHDVWGACLHHVSL